MVYGNKFYVCGHNGVVSVYQLDNGRLLNRKRLGSKGRGYRFSASPVASGGHLYFLSEDGIVFAVEATAELTIVSKNDLGDVIMASPAISNNHLYIRSLQYLWNISEK